MLDFLAERRIAEAVSRGELDNLPGAGKPLELDDDPLIPPELRMAYRILKNAGYVPAELEQVKEISRVERKLALLGARIEPRYYERALRRLSR